MKVNRFCVCVSWGMVGNSDLGLQMDPESKEVCQNSLIPKNLESIRGLQDQLGSPSESHSLALWARSVASKRHMMECGTIKPCLASHYTPLRSRRGADSVNGYSKGKWGTKRANISKSECVFQWMHPPSFLISLYDQTNHPGLPPKVLHRWKSFVPKDTGLVIQPPHHLHWWNHHQDHRYVAGFSYVGCIGAC